jgi:AcrR family transcriptional regulator
MSITRHAGANWPATGSAVMAVKVEDRRIQRTRALLLSALLDLIVERGYEELTVQDIVDRANVGRSTFYKHFLDKHELLLRG